MPVNILYYNFNTHIILHCRITAVTCTTKSECGITKNWNPCTSLLDKHSLSLNICSILIWLLTTFKNQFVFQFSKANLCLWIHLVKSHGTCMCISEHRLSDKSFPTHCIVTYNSCIFLSFFITPESLGDTTKRSAAHSICWQFHFWKKIQ